jgi:hypothetical protein
MKSLARSLPQSKLKTFTQTFRFITEIFRVLIGSFFLLKLAIGGFEKMPFYYFGFMLAVGCNLMGQKSVLENLVALVGAFRGNK